MRPASESPPVAVSCVLVVDDHRIFAELLAHRLRRDAAVEHTQVAHTVEQARAAVGERAPDVVLLDPDLEGRSGLELIEDLKLLGNKPHVVMLADAADEPPSAIGLDPEEFGWISKESSFEELVAAIEAVRRGQPPPPAARQDAEAPLVRPAPRPGPVMPMQRDGHSAADHGRTPSLTARQAEVLQCLVTGMTRAEVAARLGLSPHTVRDHVRHLFRAAGVSSTADLVAWAAAAEVARPRRLQAVRGP